MQAALYKHDGPSQSLSLPFQLTHTAVLLIGSAGLLQPRAHPGPRTVCGHVLYAAAAIRERVSHARIPSLASVARLIGLVAHFLSDPIWLGPVVWQAGRRR